MENTSKTFREIYYNLPSDPKNNLQKICRVRIMHKCDISQPTFYNWLNGSHRVPALAQQVITEIMRNYYGADVVVIFDQTGKEVTNA